MEKFEKQRKELDLTSVKLKRFCIADDLTKSLVMFRNTYQGGLLSILYSCGSAPLELWDMHVKNGYIRRITDEEIKSLALEIAGTNVATTYIYCPADPKKALGIKLPFLIIIIKNMKKYFTFEITILDDKDMHRRFRVSNFQSTTRVRPFCTSMPIGLSGGWNQIQFNLCDFTRRAYGTNYIETTRMQIHANCRIRRVYFADRLYSEDEISEDFKLFFPIHRKKCVKEERVPKKPSVVLEKVPSVITEEPTIEAEVQIKEMIEPSIPKEEVKDLIEEVVPEKIEEIIVEDEKVIKRDEEEDEEKEEEKEGEEEEEKEKEGEEEEENKKEGEEAEVEEEPEILDEEEQTELTDITQEDEDAEEAVDTSRLEQAYIEDVED